MEILTYMLSGAVEHQDSIGNKAQIPAGEFQIMSADTSMRHSEYNASNTDALHRYQTGLSLSVPLLNLVTISIASRMVLDASLKRYGVRIVVPVGNSVTI